MSVRVGLKKNRPEDHDWHHEAYRVMTNGDYEGRIFLSHIPTHTRSGDPYVSSLSEKSVPHRYPCEISVTNKIRHTRPVANVR